MLRRAGRRAWGDLRTRFLFAFLLTFFLLDVVFFRALIWRLPNEVAWESEAPFSYEYELRRLERENFANDDLILVIGSSITAYGVLPERLEKFLNHAPAPGTDASIAGARTRRVRALGRQSGNPLLFLALADRLIALGPRLIVLPTNIVDFRMERPHLLGTLRDLRGPGRKKALRRHLAELLADRALYLHAPAGTLREYAFSLGANQFARAFFASFIASYRYRDILFVGLKRYLDNRFSSGRSYDRYAGLPVLLGSVNQRGWTGRRFGLRLNERLLERGLYVQAPRELFHSGKASLGIRVARAGVKKNAGAGAPFKIVSLWRGWQRVSLRGHGIPGEVLEFRVDPGFRSERDADYLGVRLAYGTGVAPGSINYSVRGHRREDGLYLSHDEETYRKSFRARLLRFRKAGMEYIKAQRRSKQVWAARPFDAELPAFAALDRLRKKFARAGIAFVVINAPENPLSRGLYENSAWYGGYLKFLGKGGSTRDYRFLDAKALLPMNHFYDNHHLSLYGARRFTDHLGGYLREVLLPRKNPGETQGKPPGKISPGRR